jgi:hypothetical protein
MMASRIEAAWIIVFADQTGGEDPCPTILLIDDDPGADVPCGRAWMGGEPCSDH